MSFFFFAYLISTWAFCCFSWLRNFRENSSCEGRIRAALGLCVKTRNLEFGRRIRGRLHGNKGWVWRVGGRAVSVRVVFESWPEVLRCVSHHLSLSHALLCRNWCQRTRMPARFYRCCWTFNCTCRPIHLFFLGFVYLVILRVDHIVLKVSKKLQSWEPSTWY